MYLQNVNSVWEIQYNDELTYGDVFKRSEWEWSFYNFDESDSTMWLRHFNDYEAEAKRLIHKQLPIPAYDFVMKASHAFNMLDARGVISVTERVLYIARIRDLAKQLAEIYIKSREEAKYPLLKNEAEQESKHPKNNYGAFDPNMREDFLLEIGCEELPATFVPIGLAGLKAKIEKLLSDHALTYQSLKVMGTPRRLAIYIEKLTAGTSEQKVEKKGPALHVAFEPDGKLSKAGAGFFRSLNLAPLTLEECKKSKEIQFKKIGDVEYLFATATTDALSTKALLGAHLPKLILDLDFPKKMRWGKLDIEFARPLRWLLALFGKDPVAFTVGNLHSGTESHGHRLLANRSFPIAHPQEYVQKLRDHFVLVDIDERRGAIETALAKIEKELNCTAVEKPTVMAEVLHL